MALGVAAALTILLFPSASASGDVSSCPHGTKKPVEVGIVIATACWTQATVSGATVDTAAFADNPNGIDLNGFVITGALGNGLQINEKTNAVTSIQTSSGRPVSVQLNSRNWPVAGQVQALGSPFVVSFSAPTSGSLQLTDIRLGSNQIAGALAGLSPVGTIDTPVMLEPDGEGTMDLTVALAGIFTLKGKPQSVTIALPTKPNEGTKFDGFELSLKEIDGLKFVTVEDLDAHYSASQKLISGSATVKFPFLSKGIGASITIQNGVLTDLGVNVSGLQIPIGPAGFLTAIGGGFHISGVVTPDVNGYCRSIGYDSGYITGNSGWQCHKGSSTASPDMGKACIFTTGNPATKASYTNANDARSWICSGAPPSVATSFDLGANASLSAQFGPSIPSPFGEIEPIAADARLDLSYTAQELVVGLQGTFYLFRIPVGDAYLRIHSNSGVEFGAGVGIGIPSFKNNPNDPFYLGLRVDGWVGGGKFQLEGQGKFSLFSFKVLEGDGLINDRGIGACWTVLGIPGGAFYKWGSSGPEAFGTTCGLGNYREQFPAGSAADAATARTFRLTQSKTVLEVRGTSAAPRFTLRAADGRVVRVPVRGSSVMTRDYAVILNHLNRTTYVILPHARARWTITPYPGSAAVTSVKAAHIAPKERVTAEVVGTGTTRTLVYNALKLPNTRLLFLEVLRNGTKFPILNTAAGSGRHRFRVETGNGYGIRKLRVVVIQGAGSTQSRVLARYRVVAPRRLPAPPSVTAWRDGFIVNVHWAGLLGARGYLVQVHQRVGKQVVSFVRRVPASETQVLIPKFPGLPGKTTATVWTLNSDGVIGTGRSSSFRTTPSAVTFKAAARATARGAYSDRGAVVVRTQCPMSRDGYCQVLLTLVLNGHSIVTAGDQVAPGTSYFVHLRPGNPALRRALARALAGRGGHVRVGCIMFRLSQPGYVNANGTVI
jgi:hypothetical protein